MRELLKLYVQSKKELTENQYKYIKNDDELILSYWRNTYNMFMTDTEKIKFFEFTKTASDKVLLNLIIYHPDVLFFFDYNKIEISKKIKDGITNNPKYIKKILPIYPLLIKEVKNHEILDDYNIMMPLVMKVPFVLYYVSDRLKDNYDIVMAAVKKDAFYLSDASSRLKDNYDIVMAAVKKNGHYLNRASLRLQNNKDIVMAAVKNSTYALIIANMKFKDDKDVVMSAVQNDAFALQYASDRLKDDYDIVMTAIKNNGSVIQYASERLQNDPEIRKAAVHD